MLELRLATLGSRVLAILLDLSIQLTGLALLLLGLAGVSAATSASLPGWVAAVIVTFLVFLVIFGYPAILETVWNGKTVGKRVLGIRVVTTEGAPIRFRQAAIRAALELVDFFIPPGGLVACVSVLLTRDDQRLGDLAAGTFVVHERTANASASPVWFPPPWGYESYAATLDVAALDAEDYELVRSFLLRGELAHTGRAHPDRGSVGTADRSSRAPAASARHARRALPRVCRRRVPTAQPIAGVAAARPERPVVFTARASARARRRASARSGRRRVRAAAVGVRAA